jgi:adenylate cyclase
MAIEIERKFLLLNDDWKQQADSGTVMKQGYLSTDTTSSVRVRIEAQKAFLNIKSATSIIRRLEYEYPMPVSDATEILDKLCGGIVVEKIRYRVKQTPHVWEIDVFSAQNKGLIVAEIELNDEDESFIKPGWLGKEVSSDPRYLNMNLLSHPFSQW